MQNSFLLIGGSSEGVEMLLPIGRVDGCVLNGVAAVDHDAITNVDADVRHNGGVINKKEKDRNRRTAQGAVRQEDRAGKP